jgi:hypothetical protein
MLIGFSGKTQNGNNLDPNFPIFIEGESNIEMQKYAKMHPPVPNQINYSSNSLYQLKLEKWLSLTPYYPQLIPYHLYKAGLTAQDDILFFENAKMAWQNAHSGNVEKINR